MKSLFAARCATLPAYLLLGACLFALGGCASPPGAPLSAVASQTRLGPDPADAYLKTKTREDLSDSEIRYQVDRVQIAPDAGRLVYELSGTRQLSFRDGKDVYQPISETWMLERESGRRSLLDLGPGLSDKRVFYWLDGRTVLYVSHLPEWSKARTALVRHDLVAGRRTVLLETDGLQQGDYSSDGWFYYLSAPGRLAAIQPASGARRQWDLSGQLSAGSQSVQALPGGRQLLIFDDLVAADAPPEARLDTRVMAFDPAQGEGRLLTSLETGSYNRVSFELAPDGSRLAANHHTQSWRARVLDLTGGAAPVEREGFAIAWIDARQLLVQHSNRLEAYDVLAQRPVGQSPLAASDEVMGYDPATRQVLINAKAPDNSQRGALRQLRSIDFRNPAAPGQPVLLEANGSSWLSARFWQYEAPNVKPLILQDLQPQGGPFQVHTVKPGGGLELLLEVPFTGSYAFDPARLGTGPWYFGLLKDILIED